MNSVSMHSIHCLGYVELALPHNLPGVQGNSRSRIALEIDVWKSEMKAKPEEALFTLAQIYGKSGRTQAYSASIHQ
jgi:hypothetical protein